MANVERYVITSAQYGASLNQRFWNTLKNYAHENRAHLLVLPMMYGHDRLMDKENLSIQMHPEVVPYLHFQTAQEFPLNDKISINRMQILPTISRPLQGTHRVGRGTQIFASPKLHLRCFPSSNWRLPKIRMTTGTVTHGHYRDDKTGSKAEAELKFAALVVEIVDDTKYHFRQLEANGNGEICDLMTRYSANRTFQSEVSSLTLGDIHAGAESPVIWKSTLDEIIPDLRPNRIYLHDSFHGLSVDPHIQKMWIKRVLRFNEGKSSLAGELDITADRMKQILVAALNANPSAKLFECKSNHDEWIDRWLENRGFAESGQEENAEVGMELALHAIRNPGQSVLGHAMRHLDPDLDQVDFLNYDQDSFVDGIQNANHGHVGPEGRWGSTVSQEYESRRSTIAHGHYPEIWHGIWRAGTMTPRRLHYSRGANRSMNSHVVQYAGGIRQIISVLDDGSWSAI